MNNILSDADLYTKNIDKFLESSKTLEISKKKLDELETRWLELDLQKNKLQLNNIIDNVLIELMYFYNLIELTLIHLINKVKESVMEGVVKWFNFQKGYGFITPTGDEKDVFVHKTSLEKNGIRTLTEGQKVTFEVAVNKGKSSAVNIKLT